MSVNLHLQLERFYFNWTACGALLFYCAGLPRCLKCFANPSASKYAKNTFSSKSANVDNELKQSGLALIYSAALANKSKCGLPQSRRFIWQSLLFKASTLNIYLFILTLVSTPPPSSAARNNNVYLVPLINSYLQSLKHQRDFKYDIIVTARSDILYTG